MSDVSAAATAMGVPETLVERSARARAEATGQPVEDVLAAWAGGEAMAASPAPAPEPETTPEGPPDDDSEAAPAPEAPDVAPPPSGVTPSQPAAPPPSAPLGPPILESAPDRPLITVMGGLGVVILVVLLGFVFPSFPEPGTAVRSSQVILSDEARTGRDVYLRAGCASCHTQAVRSVVADVGLGPVSLADSNQVIGYRRIGPDLSDVGSRMTPDQISAVFSGANHPPLVLSEPATRALVAYVAESATSPAGLLQPARPDEGTDEEPDIADEGGDQ